MGIVSFDAAKALRELGYPQDWSDDYDVGRRIWYYGSRLYAHATDRKIATGPWSGAEWLVAAPDHLTALDWLQQKRGYLWGKRPRLGADDEWTVHAPGEPRAQLVLRGHDADSLILAIVEDWREQQPKGEGASGLEAEV